MSDVTLHGPAYSAYVRIVRLTLEEKGVAYALDEFDLYDQMPRAHFARHPFGRVPAFGHGDFMLYETAAITRYIDEAFDGPALQPEDAQARARMTQVIHIVDAYAYWPMVRQIFVERVTAPMRGQPSDEAAIAEAVGKTRHCLGVLEDLMAGQSHFTGDWLTLADLHAAPMIDYLTATDEGRELLSARPGLTDWWSRMRKRPAFVVALPTWP